MRAEKRPSELLENYIREQHAIIAGNPTVEARAE